MEDQLEHLAAKAAEKHKENKKYLQQLRKKPPRDLDGSMQALHYEEFKRTDCLQCANCCKTTGPLFTNIDIDRISKYLRIKPKQLVEKYLRIDEDGDNVLKQLPCAFLGADNYCSIYAVRPKACKEFPHTDRKKFYQINQLTLKNVAICPAAFNIVEQMKRTLSK